MPLPRLPERRSLVTRTRDGAINAFINACRHRGFPVATGPGAGNTIRCRYHAWTYDLAGNLKGAPRAEREPCFPSDELSLLPVAAHVWRDLVFVNLSDGAGAVFTAYPGLEALASERRLDLADFEYFTTASVSVQANLEGVVRESERVLPLFDDPQPHVRRSLGCPLRQLRMGM